MPSKPKGSIHLFRLAGIDVFLDWSWFLVAIVQVQWRAGIYSSNTYFWCVVEYLALFAIVLMHEFGHALACRSVGGRADHIVLWPLGGVAYVDPPPRPGATLWSLAAGPLVNVVLFPILSLCWLLAFKAHAASTMPNLYQLIFDLWWIDLLLLGFNLLPIYPLDGGQILQCLIWFFTGRARSLMIASTIGLVVVPLLIVLGLAYHIGSIWLLLIGGYALFRCWNGFKQARVLARLAAAPRHTGLACPSCHQPPLAGDFWRCPRCGQGFDLFAAGGVCPKCGAGFQRVRCFDCGQEHSVQEFTPNLTT